MKYIIHDAPGFKLEAVVTHHPITGPTVELFSTWPRANHPEPHRLLSLTLPPDSFGRLAEVLSKEAGQKMAVLQLEDRLGVTIDRSDPMLGAMASMEMALTNIPQSPPCLTTILRSWDLQKQSKQSNELGSPAVLPTTELKG